MANITGPKENQNGSELEVRITGTESKYSFIFELHGHHIAVKPLTPNGEVSRDWYYQLTEEEKLNVFNRILATYRKRSQGDGGFKLAALGITEAGHIYISENTEQLSNDFHRQCAEQNMVTIASQRDVYAQIREARSNNTSTDDFVAKTPMFRDVYLMGGRLPEIRVACPCGNCTDLLGRVMLPDSNIWILPVSEKVRDSLTIRKNIQMARGLRPGEAWKTTINYLNNERTVQLDEQTAALQQSALDQFVPKASEWLHYGGEDDPNIACGLLAPTLQLQAPVAGASLQEIDVARLHNFMTAQINVTLADRIDAIAKERGLGGLSDLSHDQINSLIDSEISWVRCAVVQRDDGKLYASVMAKSSVDKAMPNVEITALGQAGQRFGNQGVRHVWSMSLYPRLVEDGMMRTIAKASAERALKLRSKVDDTVDFHFMPYAPAGLSTQQVSDIIMNRTAEQANPGYFTGKASPIVKWVERSGGLPSDPAHRPTF
jgi:cytidine deaminase